jgi:hypothetical protein
LRPDLSVLHIKSLETHLHPLYAKLDTNSVNIFSSVICNNLIDTSSHFPADDEISVEERVGAQQNEGLVDVTVETSATFSKKFTEEQLDGTHADHNAIDYLTLNEPLCSNKRSDADETDEALGFNKLDVMVVRGDYSGGCAGSEKLHVITSEKYEMGANHIALSPVIALPSFGKCSIP